MIQNAASMAEETRKRKKEKQYEGKLAPKLLVFVCFCLGFKLVVIVSLESRSNVRQNLKNALNRFKIAFIYFEPKERFSAILNRFSTSSGR